MRWDELFADLEGQLEAGLGAEERDRDAEEERLRLGRLTLRDRIAAIGASAAPAVRIQLVTTDTIVLRPRTFGRDWVAGDLVDTADAVQAVLPMAAISGLLLDRAQSAASIAAVPPAGALTERLGLPFMLRDLGRRRRQVEVVTRQAVHVGTFDRVGRDHVDLAIHPADEWRRESSVAHIRVLSLSELVLVRVR